LALWFDVHPSTSFLDDYAILQQHKLKDVTVCIDEQVFIFDGHSRCIRCDFEVLIEAFYLLHLGGWFSIRVDDSVRTEVIISRPIAKVTTKGNEIVAKGVFFDKTLIYKVPDKTTLIHWVFVCQLSIFI